MKKPKRDKGKDRASDQSLNILELEEINPYNDEIYLEEDISEEPDTWDGWDDIGTQVDPMQDATERDYWDELDFSVEQ